MPSYTSSLRLIQPATGEYPGSWGTQVNTGLTALVDTAVAGTATITMTAADYTLTNNNGSADEARAMVLNLSGTPGAARNVICPAVSKVYIVANNTTGGFAQTIKTAAGTGVSVPNGSTYVVRCDGTNVVSVVAQVTVDVTAAGNNAFTGANTFYNVTGQTFGQTAAQDGIILQGRAGGTSSYRVTLQPTTLSANRTLTLPNTTDTVAVLGTAQTFTGTQTFSGTSSTLAMVLNDAAEVATVSATAATGTINYDITTQSVLFYTTNASGNWTVNLRASSGTSLNTAMSTGQSVTVAFLVTQGSTAYYNTTVQVDGTTSGVTTRWQGGAAPTAGYPSGVDAYVYTIIKTGSATFSVFASQTRFA